MKGFQIRFQTFILTIDTDLLLPHGDCEREQELTPESELKVINSSGGHLSLFGLDPAYINQVDKYLGELLAIPVPDNSREHSPLLIKRAQPNLV